jgi:dihydroorotate dehydrogenase (fumarate)
MPDLSTEYMGLKLKNPIIVSSCDLVKTHEGIEKCAAAGAGAVILKSIFEEQFIIEADIDNSSFAGYPEALDYMQSGGLMEYAPNSICEVITASKKRVDVPIIASINCQTDKLWPRFARQVQDAGADGLELNIYVMPFEIGKPGTFYEDHLIKIFREVKKTISIPVSVKLTPEVTSLPHLVYRLAEEGCEAVVLFNWFMRADINIEKLTTRSLKGSGDLSQCIKWVALLADRVDSDIASSGGVQNGEDVVKLLLAGAQAVQICSLFYRKGLDVIPELLKTVNQWMSDKKFPALDDLRGELSFKKQELQFETLGESGAYFRNQYLKAYTK